MRHASVHTVGLVLLVAVLSISGGAGRSGGATVAPGGGPPVAPGSQPVEPGRMAITPQPIWPATPPRKADEWQITVSETRDLDGWQVASYPRSEAGQPFAVGQGLVFITFDLPARTDVNSLAAAFTLAPAAQVEAIADFGPSAVVQVRWPKAQAGDSTAVLRLTVKAGAPLSPTVRLDKDLEVVIERHPEPTVTVSDLTSGRELIPFSGPRRGFDVPAGLRVSRFRFAKPVDRPSIERALIYWLCQYCPLTEDERPEFTWVDDKTLDVGLRFVADAQRAYVLSTNGAIDQEGVGITMPELYITTPPPVRVVAATAAGGEQPLLNINPGRHVRSARPDGTNALAIEEMRDLHGGDGDGPALFIPWSFSTTGQATSLHERLGLVHDLGYLSDGRIWAWRPRPDRSGSELAVCDPEGKVLQSYPRDGSALSGWAFSPDGSTLAYLSSAKPYVYGDASPVDHDLTICRLATGEAVTYRAVTRVRPPGDACGMMFLHASLDEDGSTVAIGEFADTNSRVLIVDTRTGAVRSVASCQQYGADVVLSGDAATVIFRVDDNWATMDLASGQQTWLKAGVMPVAPPVYSPDGRSLAMEWTKLSDNGIGERHAGIFDLTTNRLTDLGPGSFAGWSTDGKQVYLARESK